MPVPNSMSDLSPLAGSNFPTGTEAIGNSLDNYLRAAFAILRSTNALASASIAAASTTDVALADAESVQITGTATITSLGTGFNGCRRELRFTGACTLTNSANLVLPGGVNIVTAAGEVYTFRCFGTGQWLLVGSGSRPLKFDPVNKAGDTMTGTLNINTGTGISGINFTSAAGITGSVSAVDVNGNIFVGATTNHSVGFYTNNAKRMEISTSGTVGIGKNAGTNALEIQTGANTTILAKTTGGIDAIFAGVDALSGTYIGTGSAHEVGIYTNNSKRVGISPSDGAMTLNGGRKLLKITLSTSAPGTLADGELYLRY